VAGGPWPFNIVGSWARPGPDLGQTWARPGPELGQSWARGTSDERAPGLGRDTADRGGGCGGGGGRLTGEAGVRGGQSGEPRPRL